MKKMENKYQAYSGPQRDLTPFEALKNTLKNNLKSLRKEEETDKDQLA
jgi:hypothetical protein